MADKITSSTAAIITDDQISLSVKKRVKKKKNKHLHYSKIQEMRRVLTLVYPLCFYGKGQSKKPIKNGIHKDIIAQMPEISKMTLRATLYDYANGYKYLQSVQLGHDRIDLDGNAAGKINASEFENAHTKLQELNEKSEVIKKPRVRRKFPEKN